jgi:hypothetical protein
MAGRLRRAASTSASSVLRIAAGSTGLRPLPQRSTPRSTAGAEQQEGHAQAQAVDGHQDQALGGGAASTTRAGLTYSEVSMADQVVGCAWFGRSDATPAIDLYLPPGPSASGRGQHLPMAMPKPRRLAAMSLKKFAETTEAYGHEHSCIHMVPVLGDQG